MAGRLAWLAPQPPRDHAPSAPLGQVEEGSWICLDISCLSGTRGNKAGRAMSKHIRLAVKPSAGVPRRSSLTLWSLEGEPEFRRTLLRALQQRGFQQSTTIDCMPRLNLNHSSLIACVHGVVNECSVMVRTTKTMVIYWECGTYRQRRYLRAPRGQSRSRRCAFLSPVNSSDLGQNKR